MQFITDTTKAKFAMTYLIRVAQNWLKIGLYQKEQEIYQNWL